MRTSSSSLPRKRKRKDLSPLDTVLRAGWQPSVRYVALQRRPPRLDDTVSQRKWRGDLRRGREPLLGKPGTRQTDYILSGEHCRGRRGRQGGDDGRENRRVGEERSAQDIAVLSATKGSLDGGPCKVGIARSVFLVALLCAQCCLAATEALAGTQKYCTRTVKTRYGTLRGVEARSSTAVETYYGVPYATPPLGALRYMPPVTPTPWRGTKFADTMPPACPQRPPEPDASLPRRKRAYLERLAPVLANQSEDCLYLNLYVPKPPHGK